MSTLPPIPYVAFDIECRPDPAAVEKFTKPYPEFSEATVKYGNAKKLELRAEILAQAKADHEAGFQPYWEKAHADAALSPFTGQIVVIGLVTHNGPQKVLEGTEREVLEAFWYEYTGQAQAVTKFVFWSGQANPAKGFDIDYIVTRSRILGVPVPPTIRKGRYYSDRIVDLAAEFLLYDREKYCSLSNAADLMGLFQEFPDLKPKNKETDLCTGENWHRWYDGNMDDATGPAQQRQVALSYLGNDLNLLHRIANRLLS